ncbi:MAG: phosphatidate cytidylyltransferase [Planctomycetota bacterium]|jgi:phosphatidate cytidylyltransferase
MLKHRLIFGVLMTAIFTVVIIFDGWLDGSLTAAAVDKPVQGTILYLLIVVLSIPAQMEISRLAAAKKLKIFIPFSIISSILLAGGWYWPQLFELSSTIYLFFLLVFILLGLFLYQYACFGTFGTIGNCGVNYFSIIYLGVLSGFVLAVRIDFGVLPLLMFIFIVKSADIGAYTTGSLFGRRKFSPKISPGKTWEGMAGAVASAVIVAVLFAVICDIMSVCLAAILGVCFAFIGQFGDLAESMIKRDAEQKDSANNVPGFGGILDIIDSPLAAAPFAYLFFMLSGCVS